MHACTWACFWLEDFGQRRRMSANKCRYAKGIMGSAWRLGWARKVREMGGCSTTWWERRFERGLEKMTGLMRQVRNRRWWWWTPQIHFRMNWETQNKTETEKWRMYSGRKKRKEGTARIRVLGHNGLNVSLMTINPKKNFTLVMNE